MLTDTQKTINQQKYTRDHFNKLIFNSIKTIKPNIMYGSYIFYINTIHEKLSLDGNATSNKTFYKKKNFPTIIYLIIKMKDILLELEK